MEMLELGDACEGLRSEREREKEVGAVRVEVTVKINEFVVAL
jgi:hypothetical protein